MCWEIKDICIKSQNCLWQLVGNRVLAVVIREMILFSKTEVLKFVQCITSFVFAEFRP